MNVEDACIALSVARLASIAGVEAITGYRFAGNGHAMFHTEFSVRCIHEGNVQLRYRGAECLLEPGDAKVAKPGEVSVVLGRSQGYSVETQLFIEQQVLAQAVQPLINAGVSAGFQDGMLVAPLTLTAATMQLVDSLQNGGALEAEDGLLHFARVLAELPPTSMIRRSGVEPRAVRAMRELLTAEFAKNVTLDELAKEAGMSKYYAAHLFKSYVGISPHRFVTGVRVSHARRLLRQGVTCSKVAEVCGFSDQSHMTRHFSRLHEISPSRYARGGTFEIARLPKHLRETLRAREAAPVELRRQAN